MSIVDTWVTQQLARLGAAANREIELTARAHANLQTLVAASVGHGTALTIEVDGHAFVGVMFVRGASAGTEDGQLWTEVARHQDPHVAIGTFDANAADPMLWRADVEEGWDDNHNVPRPGCARRLCKLSEFVRDLHTPAPVVAGLTAAVLTEVDWSPSGMAPGRVGAARISGEAVLGRARTLAPSPDVAEASLLQGVALVGATGPVEVVPIEAQEANMISGFAWAGPDIFVVGQRKLRVTHVGLMRRAANGWSHVELRHTAPDDVAADHPGEMIMAASRSVVAYTTKVSPDKTKFENKLHVWRREGSQFVAAGAIAVGIVTAATVTSGDEIWIAEAGGVSQVVISADGVGLGTRHAASAVVAFGDGHAIANFGHSEGQLQVIDLATGNVAQRLEIVRDHAVRVFTAPGCLFVTLTPPDRSQPTTLRCFRWRDGGYHLLVEFTGVSIASGPNRPQQTPVGIALTGQMLVIDFEQHGLRRLPVPA